MAQISFFAGNLASYAISNLNGSGLGAYGAGGFGSSVAVGSYQDYTFVTDANGTVNSAQGNNIKWQHPSSGSVNGAASINLLDIPNYLATLRINFSHTSAVKIQNEQLRVYDRVSISNDPSGALIKVAQISHPSITQTSLLGSGNSAWLTPTGSSVVANLTFSSPGLSGHRPQGVNTTDMNHDYFFAISQSPNSIGSKTTAIYFQLEYL